MILGGEVNRMTEEHLLIKADGGVDELALMRRIKKYGARCEIVMLDKRMRTTRQNNIAHAMIKEIADWSGERPEDMKYILKGKFLELYDQYKWFSMSDCSVEIAYNFIDWMIAFCLEYHVPTKEQLRYRMQDIDRYMYNCLKYGVCAVCGMPGVVHHIDAIGMGYNRKTKDDSMSLKISLCSKITSDRRDETQGSCHDVAHRMGWSAFAKKYHVKGIIFNDEIEREIDV